MADRMRFCKHWVPLGKCRVCELEGQLAAALELADELRGYTHDWDWKYGADWDKQRAALNSAPAADATRCADCGGLMPEPGKRFNNVCSGSGEFPYCSRKCAEHAYWQRDLQSALSRPGKPAAPAATEPVLDSSAPGCRICIGMGVWRNGKLVDCPNCGSKPAPEKGEKA
jgi:hypothetical protein